MWILLLATLFLSLECSAYTNEYPEIARLKQKHPNLSRAAIKDIKNILFSFKNYKKLPKYYLSKKEACLRKWQSRFCRSEKQSCNLDQVAPGKSIGGNKFWNNVGLPPGDYRVADVGNFKRNKCRGSNRLIYSVDFQHIFFSPNHYKSFTTLR